MIAQDEIICRLTEGKLQGLEEGRAEGRAEGIVTCCGPWQQPGWQCLHRGQ